MTFEEHRAAREAEAAARAQAVSALAASIAFVNERIASPEIEPRRTWLDLILPPKPQRWFLWFMAACTCVGCALILWRAP